MRTPYQKHDKELLQNEQIREAKKIIETIAEFNPELLTKIISDDVLKILNTLKESKKVSISLEKLQNFNEEKADNIINNDVDNILNEAVESGWIIDMPESQEEYDRRFKV